MVTTREITYDADGRRQFAHLARPEGPGPWPTVLIGHEGIGLNDYQRRRADTLAGHGYLALAMDYHGGRWFSDPQAMVAATVPLVGDPGRMRAIGRAALDALLAEPGADPGRLAAVGYGAGGTIALEMGRDGVDLRGIAAINPAAPPPAPHDTAAIRGAVLIGVGSEDPIVTPEQLLVFTRELQAAGVDCGSPSTAGPSTPSTTRLSPAGFTRRPCSPASPMTRRRRRGLGGTCSICSPRLFPCEPPGVVR